jgi:hypothetical protein
MQTASPEGKPQLWLAAIDHSIPPRQLPNVEGGFPRFLPNGDILFRRSEGSSAAGTTGLVYAVHQDGSGMRKALAAPVLIPVNVSPDGKWFQAWAPVHRDGAPAIQAFSLVEGADSVLIGTAIGLTWSPDGRYVSINSDAASVIPEGRSYVVPLASEQTLPPIPAGGFILEEQVARLPGVSKIDVTGGDVTGGIIPGPSADVYGFYRDRVQRNLHRIPIP